jgi:hypothetical protein
MLLKSHFIYTGNFIGPIHIGIVLQIFKICTGAGTSQVSFEIIRK